MSRLEEFRQHIAELERAAADRQTAYMAALASDGIYVAVKDDRAFTITWSTSETGLLQVTWWDRYGPSGHMNVRPANVGHEVTGAGFVQVRGAAASAALSKSLKGEPTTCRS